MWQTISITCQFPKLPIFPCDIKKKGSKLKKARRAFSSKLTAMSNVLILMMYMSGWGLFEHSSSSDGTSTMIVILWGNNEWVKHVGLEISWRKVFLLSMTLSWHSVIVRHISARFDLVALCPFIQVCLHMSDFLGVWLCVVVLLKDLFKLCAYLIAAE